MSLGSLVVNKFTLSTGAFHKYGLLLPFRWRWRSSPAQRSLHSGFPNKETDRLGEEDRLDCSTELRTGRSISELPHNSFYKLQQILTHQHPLWWPSW